ncbi:MAG: toxin-antitoxin system HicB family antitoxin [Deltaproteobacteria bacterium]|nr:MAG: toxin-antitoxin system HicB family antitoxin [Deltaproteobacteria bacterium]
MGSTLTLRLPKSLHGRIKDLAKSDGISINQFLVTAAAEKMSALLTQNYLEEEAAKGQRKNFEKVLKAVPHIEPEPFDQL